MTIFNPEEKKRILIGLKSPVTATRFMTIKYLSELADKTSLEFTRLELEDPITLEEIFALLRHTESHDEDKMIRDQAKAFIEKLKLILGTKQIYLTLSCKSCLKKMTFGWLFCPHCGKKIDEMGTEIPSCPTCGNKVDRNWEFCVSCSARLKEKKVKTICTRCGRGIDPSWSLCPFCGKNLKTQ